tara:strand:- start:550 stop:744 length:195 start_codon:yes stop_codon:yes gene_type:complete
MSDYDMFVGDLVTDRVNKPERIGIIISIDYQGSIASVYRVHWMGYSSAVPYRDWEIKKYKSDKK